MTGFCSDRLRHSAFGYIDHTPQGPYCRECRVLPDAPSEAGPEDGTGPEVNLPSPTTPTPPDPLPDTSSGDAPHRSSLPPAPQRGPKPKRRCPYCGAAFWPLRNDTIWCGSRCRKNASSRRRYARDRALAGLPYHPQARMAQRTPFRLLLEEEPD